MRRLVIFAAFLLLSMTVVAGVVAQEACGSFINQALQALSSNCGDLQRNNACYGFNHVTATLAGALAPDAFAHPNDRVDLADVQSITTAPLDVTTQQWGIAVMKAQANLPDALPGQAVTFLLLGDVQVKTGVEAGSDQKPMQAVYFTTGIGGNKCNDAPQSSLIIQGPQGATVNMRVNGADISFGSTLVFRSGDNSTMECGVLDGAAHVGEDQVIPAGFIARVPLDQNLDANGDWGGNQPLQDEDATALQVLKDVPDGVLSYAPDVPTSQEVDLMAMLDPSFVQSYDPHELRGLVRVFIAQDVTPEMLAEWSSDQLDTFIADNGDEIAAETEAEAPPTPDASDASESGSDDSGG